MVSWSPIFKIADGLMEVSSRFTFPPSHALVAWLRVLKKRAAQRNLSARIFSSGSDMVAQCIRGRISVNMQVGRKKFLHGRKRVGIVVVKLMNYGTRI